MSGVLVGAGGQDETKETGMDAPNGEWTDAMSKTVPDSIKVRMIGAYPTVSGMTAEFLAWHATAEERAEAWDRVIANRHLREVVRVTMRQRWERAAARAAVSRG